MDGILLIAKSKGMTSHDVVSRVRHLIGMRRVGHAGTLDPDATGLLVVCLGRATKVSSLIAASDKIYRVHFQLGRVSTTYDSTGETVSEHPVNVTAEQLKSVLDEFVGNQEQTPPLYSAVKVKGKKLYEYAREGEPVEIPTRRVTVHSIELLSFTSPDGGMEVSCGKGTYVRSLVHDIGQRLGSGAITTAIERVECGALRLADAMSLDELAAAPDPKERAEKALIPIARALSTLPILRVTSPLVRRITQGAGLRPRDLSACRWENPTKVAADPVLLVGDDGLAVGLGAYDGLASVQIRRVF